MSYMKNNMSDYEEAKAAVQELLDEVFNFHDHSVGIQSIGSITDDIAAEFEGEGLVFTSYDDSEATLWVDGHEIRISIVYSQVGPDDFESKWQITG